MTFTDADIKWLAEGGPPHGDADLSEVITALARKIRELERGEYICRKCGIRKDAQFERGEF